MNYHEYIYQCGAVSTTHLTQKYVLKQIHIQTCTQIYTTQGMTNI